MRALSFRGRLAPPAAMVSAAAPAAAPSATAAVTPAAVRRTASRAAAARAATAVVAVPALASCLALLRRLDEEADDVEHRDEAEHGQDHRSQGRVRLTLRADCQRLGRRRRGGERRQCAKRQRSATRCGEPARQPRLGDDPVRVVADVGATRRGREPNRGRGPQVRRRLFAEQSQVRALRPAVPIAELGCFRSTARRRVVMQRGAQNPAAEVAPVAAGVEQVEVPDLVDLLRRRDGVAGAGREVEEAAIFGDGASRELGRPAGLPREPGGEGRGGARRIECEIRKLGPKIVIERRRKITGRISLS